MNLIVPIQQQRILLQHPNRHPHPHPHLHHLLKILIPHLLLLIPLVPVRMLKFRIPDVGPAHCPLQPIKAYFVVPVVRYNPHLR